MTDAVALATAALALPAAAAGWTAVQSARINARFPAEGRLVPAAGETAHVLARAPQAGATPFLLLHGAASNGRELPAALDTALEAAVPGAGWIAPDRPGLGHSTRSSARFRQLGEQARFVAEAVQALGPARPMVVAGHSWGSAVALRLALDHPRLVKALVLLAPATHPWPGATMLANRLGAMPLVGSVLSWMLPAVVGPLMAPAGIARAFEPGPSMPGYADRIGTALYLRPAAFRANAADMMAAADELRAQHGRYGALRLPVAIVTGQGDRIVSNRLHAGGLKRDLPHAETHRVALAGHMPHWVDPALVAGIMARFQAAA